jgi:eukaryotic-like serine/threonine-protein kinase
MKTETRQSASTEAVLVDLVDEFTARLDRGEAPRVDEYAARHPALTETVRQLLYAILAVRTLSGESLPAVESEEVPVPLNGGVGDYRILREIGRGGMGVVYEAVQVSLGRRVALKVLPFAAVLDPRKLERFKHEAQAAAQLHHTHIVPVFAVGCDRGVHYYAMQFIEGQPLSAVVAELRCLAGLDAAEPGVSLPGAPGPTSARGAGSLPAPTVDHGSGHPGRAMPSATGSSAAVRSLAAERLTNTPAFFRSVARLGIQAAQALDHAHAAGVVHRDIKPSNLLLDAHGSLWVADFGLALIGSDPGLTRTGDVLGTFRYMSPEQALGKRLPLDHRTDIYALGATLYELLTLQPAFTGRDRQELLRQITFEEPPPPRRLNRAIPLELETIILKAMSKPAPDRYETAQQLADDLQRFLADEPIRATPPSRLKRAAKWSRRHRTAVASAAVLLVVAVVTLSVSTVLIWRAGAEAVQQRNAAQAQSARAEANFRLARDALDQMLTRVAAVELGGEAQMEKVRQALLEDGLQFHEQFFRQKADDPSVRADAGHAYIRVGHINALLGQDERAEEAYRGAIDLYQGLHADYPTELEYQVALADSFAALATMLWEAGRYGEAEPPVRQALGVLRELRTAAPEQADTGRALARGLNLWGLILRNLQRVEEAEAAWRECIALNEALTAASPEQPEPRLELARSLRNLAQLLFEADRNPEGEVLVRQALTLQEALVAAFPGSLDYGAELAHTKRWWEEMQTAGGRPREAAADTGRESPLWRATLAQLPAVPWYRERLARSYQGLFSALERTGRPLEAEAAHQRAVELQEQLVSSHPDVAEYRVGLVNLHLAQARTLKLTWRPQEAGNVMRRAIEIQKQLIADFPQEAAYRLQLEALYPELDEALGRVGVGELIALSKQSPEGVAEAVARARSIDLTDAALDPFTRLIYAEYRMLNGDFEAAAAAIQRALDEGAGRTYQKQAFFKSLGWALLGCGRRPEAQAAFEQAVDHVPVRNAEGLRHECPDPWTAAYFLDLVTVEQYTGRWQHDVLCGRSLACFPWFYVGMRMELEHRTDEARAAYRRCVELGSAPNAHHTAHWAAYRLGRLTEPQ